jgi:hypothetical protein
VYPNPAKDILNVEGADNAEYSVTNILGKEVKRGTINDKVNSIGIAFLPPGVYLLKLNENGFSKKMKFTKE